MSARKIKKLSVSLKNELKAYEKYLIQNPTTSRRIAFETLKEQGIIKTDLSLSWFSANFEQHIGFKKIQENLKKKQYESCIKLKEYIDLNKVNRMTAVEKLIEKGEILPYQFNTYKVLLKKFDIKIQNFFVVTEKRRAYYDSVKPKVVAKQEENKVSKYQKIIDEYEKTWFEGRIPVLEVRNAYKFLGLQIKK